MRLMVSWAPDSGQRRVHRSAARNPGPTDGE